MKTKSAFFGIVLFMSFNFSGNAQFLKKLKNKIKSATESVMSSNSDEEAERIDNSSLIYDLDGTWTRVSGNNHNANGMRVEITDYKGIIIDAASTRLKEGDLKWKDIKVEDSMSLTHQELGSNYSYYDATMTFVHRDTLKLNVVASGAGNYQTWVRSQEQKPQLSSKNKPNKPNVTTPNNNSNDNSPNSNNTGLNGIYGFEWKYVLTMETPKAKDKIKMEYYLKRGADYWGARMHNIPEPLNQLMIYDGSIEKMLILMEQDGMKMKMTQPLNMGMDDIGNDDNFKENFTSKYLGKKTILGFECEGYRHENRDYTFIIYATTQPGVSFNQVFSANSKKMPKGMSDIWAKNDMANSLVMEMEMIDKKKSKNSMRMECVELVESPFSVNTSNYKSFGRN